VLKDATPEMLKAFGADRAAMNPNLRRATVTDGAAAVATYLARLEHMLSNGQPFLLGALPSIADFSAAQSVWFMQLAPPVAVVLDAYPKVDAWYQRVHGFGQGEFTKMKSAEAIEVAAQGQHAPLSFTAEPGLARGHGDADRLRARRGRRPARRAEHARGGGGANRRARRHGPRALSAHRLPDQETATCLKEKRQP